MNTRNNIEGFFSYARQNDKHEGGYLTSLRKSLEFELWAQTGNQIDIFQDQEDILWGDKWKNKIITSLNKSKFIIAVITPIYLKSEACKFELEQFLILEKKIGSERVLPLIFIDTPELKTTKDPVFSEIISRQWFDWTNLRFSSLTSVKAKKQLVELAKRIQKLIQEDLILSDETNTIQSIPNSVVNPNFPNGWDTEWQPSFDKGIVAANPEPKLKKNDEIVPSLVTRAVEELRKSNIQNESLTPSLYVPISKNESNKKPQQITIALRATGDRARDSRRIKTLYGTLISYHGQDKFSFQILENGKNTLFDFPDDTTRICPELINRLKILGKDSLKITTEDISFP